MDVSGKKVLIVGATGFIGSHLADTLSKAGATVVGASRNAPTASPWWDDETGGWSWAHCQASDASSVDALFETHKPQIVYHLTSDSKGGRALDLVRPSVANDIVATVNVMTAAANHGCERFVMAASLEEPRGQAEHAAPVSPYAAAKYTTGVYARMFHTTYGLPVVLMRPFMGYGPRQNKGKLVPSIILSILRGEPVKIGSPHRPADWIFVDDVVDGFARAASAPDTALGKTFDLGCGGDLITVGAIATSIGRQMDRPDLIELGAGASRGEEMVRPAQPESTQEEFGWSARASLDEGLHRTISWFQRYKEKLFLFVAGCSAWAADSVAVDLLALAA